MLMTIQVKVDSAITEFLCGTSPTVFSMGLLCQCILIRQTLLREGMGSLLAMQF